MYRQLFSGGVFLTTMAALFARVPGTGGRILAPHIANAFAITAVRVEVGDGRVLENATVVVREGKIAQILSGDEVPAGIKTVSGKGKTLYPGFIDGYSSQGVKSPTPDSGEGRPSISTSAPPTMWIGNRKGISPEFKGATSPTIAKDDDRFKSGITTALCAPGQGSLRGLTALVDLSPTETPMRVVKPAFGMAMAFRVGSGSGYPGNILGGIALMRQVLIDAKSLSEGAELYPSAAKKPNWMASLEALQPVMRGQMPAVIEANMDREIERSFRLADEFGFPFVIFGGRDAYKVADKLAGLKVPVILTADIGTEPTVTADKGEPADATPVEYKQERNALWQVRSHNAEILDKAHVPFAFSSEGATEDFLKGVRFQIKRGLPREAALRALTIGAASIFGAADHIGTVSEGKRANLVLMSGDFADEKSTVDTVWVDGQITLETKAAVKK